jgi:hypothetical protein
LEQALHNARCRIAPHRREEELPMNVRTAFHRRAALAAGALLVGLAAGCATTPRDDGLSANPPLLPGWQDNARPLFYGGPGISPGTTAWTVPMTLPRGTYVVIQRDGDRARVVDGQRFEMDGAVYREIKLMLPMGQNNLEALDVKYLASAAPAKKSP